MSDDGGWDFDKMMDEAEASGQNLTIISPDMMRKRLVWDVAPCEQAAEVAAKVGLKPASSEVEDMEHRQSHQRLINTAPVVPIVQMMSFYVADAVRGAMMVEHGDEVGEHAQMQAEALGPLIFTSTLAILAEMFDTGIIHMGPIGAVEG